MSDPAPGTEGSRPQGPQPVFLLPTSIAVLAGLIIAVHLAAAMVLNDDADLQLTLWFGFIPLRALEPDGFPGGLLPIFWTPVSHAFLHAGFEHLALNVAWLAIFGTPVARRYGGGPMLMIFLASAVVGALAFALTTLPTLQVLIGASGGVSGLTGAAMRFIFQPPIVPKKPETGQPVLIGRKLATMGEMLRNPQARTFAIFWVLFNAAVPLFPLLLGQDVQIAWQAHLGGFFTGLLLVKLFERQAPR